MQGASVQSLRQEDPLEEKWQPTPGFLPGKSHGQRSLAGYRPQGCKSVGHDLATKQLYSGGDFSSTHKELPHSSLYSLPKSPLNGQFT